MGKNAQDVCNNIANSELFQQMKQFVGKQRCFIFENFNTLLFQTKIGKKHIEIGKFNLHQTCSKGVNIPALLKEMKKVEQFAIDNPTAIASYAGGGLQILFSRSQTEDEYIAEVHQDWKRLIDWFEKSNAKFIKEKAEALERLQAEAQKWGFKVNP